MSVIPTKSGDRLASSASTSRRPEADASSAADFAALFGSAWMQQNGARPSGTASGNPSVSDTADAAKRVSAERVQSGAETVRRDDPSARNAGDETADPSSESQTAADTADRRAQQTTDTPTGRQAGRGAADRSKDADSGDRDVRGDGAETAGGPTATSGKRTDQRTDKQRVLTTDALLARRLLKTGAQRTAADDASATATSAKPDPATEKLRKVSPEAATSETAATGTVATTADDKLTAQGMDPLTAAAQAASATAEAGADRAAMATAPTDALKAGGAAGKEITDAAGDALRSRRSGKATTDTAAAVSTAALPSTTAGNAQTTASGAADAQAFKAIAESLSATPGGQAAATAGTDATAGNPLAAATTTQRSSATAGNMAATGANANDATARASAAGRSVSESSPVANSESLRNAAAVTGNADTSATRGTDERKTSGTDTLSALRTGSDRSRLQSPLSSTADSKTASLADPQTTGLSITGLRVEGSAEKSVAERAASPSVSGAAPASVALGGLQAFQTIAAQDEPPKLVMATPITDPGFAEELHDTLQLVSTRGLQSVEISITPEELGPIRMKVEMNGSQADVSFEAAQEQTRTLLADAVPALREQLSQSGIDLRHATVDRNATWSGSGQQNQSPFNGQGMSGGDGNSGRNRGGDGGSGDGRGTRDLAEAPAARRIRNGLLDTYA